MDTIRTFIAINLSPEIKKELEKIISTLRSQNAAPAKWVNAESIHLTLKFLGDISSTRVSEVLDAIKIGLDGIPSFQIQVAGLGVFPNPSRTRVVWAGITGDKNRLGQLQKNVEISMEELGFSRENREFNAHLTLARVRDHTTPDDRTRLGTLVTGTHYSGDTLTVNSVDLMKSQLTRQGAQYTCLGSIRLK